MKQPISLNNYNKDLIFDLEASLNTQSKLRNFIKQNQIKNKKKSEDENTKRYDAIYQLLNNSLNQEVIKFSYRGNPNAQVLSKDKNNSMRASKNTSQLKNMPVKNIEKIEFQKKVKKLIKKKLRNKKLGLIQGVKFEITDLKSTGKSRNSSEIFNSNESKPEKPYQYENSNQTSNLTKTFWLRKRMSFQQNVK